MQVCYAVATDGDRHYVDLVAISALAVRRIHPAAQIAVLTDDESLPAVTAMLAPAGLADAVRSVGAYPAAAGPRSRFVKTQTRQFMDGDFVFLDADAIPVAAFDELFRSGVDLCAAIDRSPTSPEGSGFPSFAVAAFDRLGWAHPTPSYVNCGVVFWKDNARNRRLATLWHDNWRRFFHESGDFADQPAFNFSCHSLGIRPGTMSDRYNARVSLSQDFASDACIYHFYTSDQGLPGRAALDDLLAHHRRGEALSRADIDAALQRCHDMPRLQAAL